MQLRNLKLAEFRNFALVGSSEQTVEFGPRFTVLHGHNGAGKTNILEALYLVSTLRSFRTADTRALLRRGSDHARVQVEAFDPKLRLSTLLEVRLDRTANATRRTARLDGKLVRSAVDFYGRIAAVLFTPEDLEVLRGAPGGRRQFLDRVLFARERAHIGDVQAYDKLLRSRNRVLKLEGPELPPAERVRLLDTYDHGLADVGARIWARRVELVGLLREGFSTAFTQIHAREALVSGHFQSDLRYVSRVPEPGRSPTIDERRRALASALSEHRRRDEAARRTTVGPHLDDLEVTLDGTVAGDFASQGQARALVLAFKIAELRAARERGGEAPLLLLDDVSSELDPSRTGAVYEVLRSAVSQTFVTTTRPELFPTLGERRGERADWIVRDGRLERVA